MCFGADILTSGGSKIFLFFEDYLSTAESRVEDLVGLAIELTSCS